MPPYFEPPTGSPFLSVAEKDPDRSAAKLRTLILSDLKAVPQRVAQLSQWLSARNYSFTIDVILVVGVSRPAPNCETRHEALAEQAHDTMTITELEYICPRVVYVPGLHEHPTAWETEDESTPKLTPFSHNAIAGPIHIAPDLYIVHRRFADGISDEPIHHLPLSWKQTIYSKLTKPLRFRLPLRPSAIVLCSSQLPDDHASKSKTIGFFRSVRSLLSLSRSQTPDIDFILAIAPPKMQRVPNSSTVYRNADRTLDPGSFNDGYFCIATFVRPASWDPKIEPDVDDEQLDYESAWEVENITKYNIDYKVEDEDDSNIDDDDRNSFNGQDPNADRTNSYNSYNSNSSNNSYDNYESFSDHGDSDRVRANNTNRPGNSRDQGQGDSSSSFSLSHMASTF